MWFDKKNKNTMYIDKRTEFHILCDGRTLEIKPDIECDFSDMPFDNESFHLVVFDPPHLDNLGKNSWMAKKYGVLSYSWRNDIQKGFDECWRVLKPNGTLIFKWNESRIKVKDVLPLFSQSPIFGHTTSTKNTIWMTFFKAPK